MAGYLTLLQCGSVIDCQRRYALRRHSSMNGGSFFFAEIMRMMSSFSPRGTVSVSTSVTKPCWYSRVTRDSIDELIKTPERPRCHGILSKFVGISNMQKLGRYNDLDDGPKARGQGPEDGKGGAASPL